MLRNLVRKFLNTVVHCIAGSFKPGENGMILKKSTDKERECLTKLMTDILRPYIPEYRREVDKGGERILKNSAYPSIKSYILLSCHHTFLTEVVGESC